MFRLCDYCAKATEKAHDGYHIMPEMGVCSSCGSQRGFFYVYNRKPIKKRTTPTKRHKDKGDICHYCNLDMTDKQHLRTLDHKIPKSKGGKNNAENILIACQPCNLSKGNMDYDEFIKLRREK